MSFDAIYYGRGRFDDICLKVDENHRKLNRRNKADLFLTASEGNLADLRTLRIDTDNSFYIEKSSVRKASNRRDENCMGPTFSQVEN